MDGFAKCGKIVEKRIKMFNNSPINIKGAYN